MNLTRFHRVDGFWQVKLTSFWANIFPTFTHIWNRPGSRQWTGEKIPDLILVLVKWVILRECESTSSLCLWRIAKWHYILYIIYFVIIYSLSNLPSLISLIRCGGLSSDISRGRDYNLGTDCLALFTYSTVSVSYWSPVVLAFWTACLTLTYAWTLWDIASNELQYLCFFLFPLLSAGGLLDYWVFCFCLWLFCRTQYLLLFYLKKKNEMKDIFFVRLL